MRFRIDDRNADTVHAGIPVVACAAAAHAAATAVEVAVTGGIHRNSHTQHEHQRKQKCEKSFHGFLLSKLREKETAQSFLTAPC